MATIKDIAKMTGFSTSTVSRALSGNVPVNKETKETILEAVKKLNYKPNPVAKALKERKTKTIGLIIPNICNPIFPALCKGVEDTARQNGYNVILCNTDENIEIEKETVAMMKKRWVDGLIFATASTEHESIMQLKQEGIPVMLVIRNFGDEIDSVVTNNYEAAYEIVSYLIERGHKRIAIINGNTNIGLYRERYEGYKQALIDADLPIFNELSFSCSFEDKECYMKTQELLNKDILPDAIFATTDLRAIEAIKSIQDNGLEVPKDISVAGFDDIEISSFMNPTLTTISQPFYEIGKVAVEKLLKVINSDKKDNKQANITKIKSKLIIRDSTR